MRVRSIVLIDTKTDKPIKSIAMTGYHGIVNDSSGDPFIDEKGIFIFIA